MNNKFPIQRSKETKKKIVVLILKKISNTINPYIFEILGIKYIKMI